MQIGQDWKNVFLSWLIFRSDLPKTQVFCLEPSALLIAPPESQRWIYKYNFRQNAGAIFNDPKLAFVIQEIRKFGQLRDGFPFQMAFITISVTKFTVYIQEFGLRRYYYWVGHSQL